MKALHFFLSILFFLVAFLEILPPAAYAQKKTKVHTLSPDEAKSVKKDAATLFNTGNYDGALKAYLELLAANPADPELNYRLGYCYLLTNVDKAKAAEYFEASGKTKNARKETAYFLGLAYMYAERWDEAIESFESYKESTHSKPIKDFTDVERQIEMCNNAKKLTDHPLNVTFENLGKIINSPYEDFNPFISANEKMLVFSSRRKGNIGGMNDVGGFTPSDVYFSTWKDSLWTKPKNAGPAVNSDWDEESIGLTADGTMMIVYLDNMEAYGDIGYSKLKGKTWQQITPFLPPVNSKDFETGASITLDGSTIYFASERKDVIGNSDLYYSKRKDNGDWGPAVNLGPVINTKYEEDAPFISMDGKTLYFSSKGHNSMGGYDVFRSVLDDSSGTWSEPVNIGYPINDADDNLFFSMTGDQRIAYIAAVRKGGLGDKDIYKITYNDTSDHPFLALISGIISSESGSKVELVKAMLTDKFTKKIIMTYKPSVAGNEFVLAAKPGEYILSIEGYSFKTYKENIKVPNEFPLKNIYKSIKVATAK